MPDWLPKLLVEFPAVAIMGGIFWYARREVKALHTESLRRADQSHAAQVQSKDQEIARLNGPVTGELRVLARRVEALNRKLS